MFLKEEEGIAGIDIAISIIIITIFIAVIGNLIVNINLSTKNVERKTIATSYAVQEIEKIKSQAYIDKYENKGIDQEDIFEEDDEDIFDDNGEFTGYHKRVLIKDYVLIKDSTKQPNLVKEVIVEISYKLGNKEQNVRVSTYIAKE